MGQLPAAYRRQGKKLAQAARLWASGHLTTQTDDDDDTATNTQVLDEAFAFWGLQADTSAQAPEPPAVFYLWPECVDAWGLWQRIQTQWRVGMAGRDGLDYAGLCAYLHEVERIKPRKFAEVFAFLQAMESAALEAWQNSVRKTNNRAGQHGQ